MRRDLLLYAVAITLLGGIKLTYDRAAKVRAVLEERLRVADSTVAVLSQRARTVDTVYRRDTVRLTRQVTRWRDSVVARIDTLSDTVHVPVEVVRWVAAEADSTIRACQTVVVSCEARVAVRDTLITALRGELSLARKYRPPGPVRKWAGRLVWVATGSLLADVFR